MKKHKKRKNIFISEFNPSGSYTGNYCGKEETPPEQDVDDL